LPVLWILAAWLTRAAARDSNWSKIVDPQLLQLLLVRESRRGSSAWPLVGLIWTLVVVALSGPSWTHTSSPAYKAPASWVLVLDLSPSMNATDSPPSRIARARYAAADILAAAQDARVGLVVFAGEAHTVTPLTTDVATAGVLLQPLSPGLMPESGDRLAPALEEAQRLLSAAGFAQHGQVIVLSDGVADPVETLRVASELHQKGSTVNVIGIGTASGGPEPAAGNGGFIHDADGRVHISRLQTEQLRHIASSGGGEYVPVSGVPALIHALDSQHFRSMEETASAEKTELSTWQNEGIWLLPPVLLLAAWLARRGWV
jgi:Ca-activated chloride channel family protein